MKKIFFFAAAIIVMAAAFGVSPAFGQKLAIDQKKTKDLDAKIQKTKVEIARLDNSLSDLIDYSSRIKILQKDIDSLYRLAPETEYGKSLRSAETAGKEKELKLLVARQKRYASNSWKYAERDRLQTALRKYEVEREGIFDAYISETSVPKELSNRETRLRQNGLAITTADRVETNQARREELGFQKMAGASVSADSVLGYEGFVQNLSKRDKVLFSIYSLSPDGHVGTVEIASFLTNPGDRIKHFLIPGTYVCRVFVRGEKKGEWTFGVGPQKFYNLGEWTHWAVQKEDEHF